MRPFLPVLMSLLAMMPSLSQAGAGYDFLVSNQMTPLKEFPDYPQVTVQGTGILDCWYLNDLAFWAKPVTPGQYEVHLYTEAANSGGCWQTEKSAEIAMYVREKPGAPWVQLGDLGKIHNQSNLDNGFYMHPPLPNSGPLAPMCGLDVNSYGYQLSSVTPGGNMSHVKVSGTLKLTDCKDAHAERRSLQVSEASAMEMRSKSLKSQKVIELKVGEKKKISLAGLDSQSVWELDNGRCEGDAVKSDLNMTEVRKRHVLPQNVVVTGVAVGEETCNLTSYHDPGRILNSTRSYLFKVK